MERWFPTDLWEDRDAVFLVTKTEENERLVRELAQEQLALTPGYFDGTAPLVYNRLAYVPPYETFGGLRRLAAQIRDAAGLRAEFRGIVALDLQEWLDHENELYLSVTFKYLHDHRRSWKILVTAGEIPARRMQPLLLAAAPYLRPDLRQLCLFQDRALLQSYLHAHADLEPAAAAVLAGVCMRAPALHSCAVTGQILDELRGHTRTQITTAFLRRYLQEETSLPALLGASPYRAPGQAPEGKEM